MKKYKYLLVLPAVFLVSCSRGTESIANSLASSLSPIQINDFNTYVYQNIDLSSSVSSLGEAYTYTYEGDDIRIDGDTIVPLKAKTTTQVKIRTTSGREGQFEVKIINRDYESKHAATETSEGWFNDITVDKITALDSKEEFYNGIDISSCKYLYDLGAKFYNEDGVEQSLFYILKDHGVNSIRLRLWNDPKDGDYSYGGGMCDLEHVKWMAKEAKKAGLTYLLDFHYSDFWADPSKQVVPKAWKDFTSVEAFEQAIYDFTYDTLTELKNEDILPDIVQIGNETVRGILTDYPGASQTEATGNDPKYISGATTLNSTLAGRYTEGGNNTNLVKYISSGIKAVKEVSSSIQTMIHLAKGLSGTDFITNYYNEFDDVDYDIIGLSGYAYWHFSSIATLRSSLATLSSTFSDKKICIVETSYGFTYETDNNASNSFSTSSDCNVVNGYPCSVQGQAKLTRDIIDAVASISNGIGTYYWEGAWIPVYQGGWSDKLSKASWSNQGFFSYDGKMTSALTLYEQI